MKKEKGSITLYVLIACIFFVVILSIVYTNMVHKKQTQEENIAQIQANYAKNLSETNSSGNGCSCNTDEILQRLEKVEKEVVTLTTENTQKTNLINELTTRLADVESDIKGYKITDSTTCDQLLEYAVEGRKIYYAGGSIAPSYGGGIIFRMSSTQKRIKIIMEDDDSIKTYSWFIRWTNGNELVKDCVTVTALN